MLAMIRRDGNSGMIYLGGSVLSSSLTGRQLSLSLSSIRTKSIVTGAVATHAVRSLRARSGLVLLVGTGRVGSVVRLIRSGLGGRGSGIGSRARAGGSSSKQLLTKAL
jgi:hypothetical protein